MILASVRAASISGLEAVIVTMAVVAVLAIVGAVLFK